MLMVLMISILNIYYRQYNAERSPLKGNQVFNHSELKILTNLKSSEAANASLLDKCNRRQSIYLVCRSHSAKAHNENEGV